MLNSSMSIANSDSCSLLLHRLARSGHAIAERQ